MTTTKWLIKATLVGVVLIALLTGCPGVCPDAVHSFAITSSFTPQKDSIKVGDTLYLSSAFPAQLKDVRSGQQVDYKGASNIGSDIFFDELPIDKLPLENPANSLIYAVDGFSFVAIKGRVYTDATAGPKRVKQLTYQQLGANYELLIGIIPNRKGVFCLTLGNGFSGSRPNQGCDKAAFDIRVTNTNQHLYFLEKYFSTSVEPYRIQKGYCFKVY